jgi:hypothetical protein
MVFATATVAAIGVQPAFNTFAVEMVGVQPAFNTFAVEMVGVQPDLNTFTVEMVGVQLDFFTFTLQWWMYSRIALLRNMKRTLLRENPSRDSTTFRFHPLWA